MRVPLTDAVAEPTAATRGWWDRTRQRRLAVQVCDRCGHRQHHPRLLCTACGATGLRLQDAAGIGSVHSYTVVHRPPHPGVEVPYVVALIDLTEGVRILSNLVEVAHEEVRCGLPVTVDWVPLPDGRHLPVFRPAVAEPPTP